jgi:hypothetical protein
MFGKKRGHRRTGSKTLGSAGEALFFAFLLAMGTAFLVVLLTKWVVPEWRANHEFIEKPAVVLETRIAEDSDTDGKPVFRPEAKIRYQIDDRVYEPWTYDIARAWLSSRDDAQAMLDRIEVGREYFCWYDPLNPTQAVLVRGYSWWFWLLLLIPAGFIFIGSIGLGFSLWHWGKSTEHRAARGQLGKLDLFEEIDATAKDFPTVPPDGDLTNSPGTHLKYRLPIFTSQGWKLLAATVACIFWNGIVAMLIVVAIHRHWRGEADWWLDLFVLPFMIVGGFLIYYFVRALLIATGVGPTLIEISDHPLWPGKTYELYFEQSGHLSINSFKVTLECEEISTYRQGTDARTDRRTVYRQELFHTEHFEILPGEPFKTRCEVSLPANVMHSFKADHNEVQWKLVICGQPEGWPVFDRHFPVVVYPAAESFAETQSELGEPKQELSISPP